tara:strand:- start:1118 stop:1489 length:372 start_codon:yes stop_codon:yes gene_type:complete
MRKLLGMLALAIVFLATPAHAQNMDIVNLKAVAVTTFTLDPTITRPVSGTMGAIGSVFRFTCTVSCYVALDTTNGDGSFTPGAASNFLWLPANTPAYVKSPGVRYIIGLGGTAGTLFVTEMAP